MTPLQELQAVMRGDAPPPPIAQLIGFTLLEIERGKTLLEFQSERRHANPMGTLHGGVLCDITDAAMGMAYYSTLQPGESFTTLEIKLNFLKPVWESKLTVRGWLIKEGRTVGLTAADVTDENGSLVAHATSTCLTLRGEQASGR